jgi:hypothetical protein
VAHQQVRPAVTNTFRPCPGIVPRFAGGIGRTADRVSATGYKIFSKLGGRSAGPAHVSARTHENRDSNTGSAQDTLCRFLGFFPP